jgi:ribosomal protein S18 acetylase RimI-like enzyme
MAALAARAGFERWTPARFEEALCGARARAFIAGDIEGFAIGSQVMDEVELHLIVVAPERRRRGVGRALLEAFQSGVTEVHLEVSERNTNGIAFYEAQGFNRVGRRPDYYGPGEAALLMTRRL